MANANPCTARSFELCCRGPCEVPHVLCLSPLFSHSLSKTNKKKSADSNTKAGGLRSKRGPPPSLAGSSLDKKGFVENRQKDDWELGVETQDST